VFLQVLRQALQSSGLAHGFVPSSAGAAVALHVILVDTAEIRELNRNHLGKNRVTDVIAFDLRDTPPTPGEAVAAAEIYVCLDVAVAATSEYTTSTGHEVILYVVHGMLHLAGEDDASAAGRRRMRKLETKVMEELHAHFPVEDLF